MNYLKSLGALTTVVGLALALNSTVPAAESCNCAAEGGMMKGGCGGTGCVVNKLGWKLGTQAYTFNRFTFVEAVEKASSIGLQFIEIYPGQRISEEVEAKTHHTMSAEHRKLVLDTVAQKGMRIVAYGVVNTKSEEEWRQICEFAQSMGIGTICSEPEFDQIDMIEKLCVEHGVNLALHNHPTPSRYWDPKTVVENVQSRSPLIGACADTGHWLRSGIDPLDAIKLLDQRIIQFHFKDLNQKERQGAHDVPWGTGVNDVYAMMAQIKRQGFQGVFSIEYEHNWENSLPEIKQSVEYFNMAAKSMLDCCYQPLFTEDLSNAQLNDGGWAWEDGALVAKGNGDIWTKERYGDFILDLEFKCAENTNSGVFVRTDDIAEWLNTAIEVQIQQATSENTRHNMGAIFDVQAPYKTVHKPAGEWNHYTIMAKGPMIYAVLNGHQIMHIDLDRWTEAGKNPDGSKNKFKYAYAKMAREGFIGLQYHGHPIAFRNLRIKPIGEGAMCMSK